MAKAQGVISDARIGLADLCAKVLHERLDKSTPLRVRTDWDSPQLSNEQLQYAALDASASLQLYHCLSEITVPMVITESALPGTPVSVLQDDGQVIAHGILSLEPLNQHAEESIILNLEHRSLFRLLLCQGHFFHFTIHHWNHWDQHHLMFLLKNPSYAENLDLKPSLMHRYNKLHLPTLCNQNSPPLINCCSF